MDFALKLTKCLKDTGRKTVSILVLMDFALKRVNLYLLCIRLWGFNPCFDGFCSKTRRMGYHSRYPLPVSILVLMDFALKPQGKRGASRPQGCFNPCFDGFCSKTWRILKETWSKTMFQSLF